MESGSSNKRKAKSQILFKGFFCCCIFHLQTAKGIFPLVQRFCYRRLRFSQFYSWSLYLLCHIIYFLYPASEPALFTATGDTVVTLCDPHFSPWHVSQSWNTEAVHHQWKSEWTNNSSPRIQRPQHNCRVNQFESLSESGIKYLSVSLL